MYTIHATKKLLDRVRRPALSAGADTTTALGNWYATATTWRPQQVALLVNERTLLPVLMPLAPAATLAQRFPTMLAEILTRLDIPSAFITAELAAMHEAAYAKTANRSVVGSMNDFVFLAERYRAQQDTPDLIGLSVRLADTPCGPLYNSHTFPRDELAALVATWPTT